MRQSSVALAVLLCGSACTEAPEGVAERLDESLRASVGAQAVIVDEISPGSSDVCDLLPDDCGPCAVACDFEALREFVPVGTCAAFLCELVDGTRVTFHACHPR